MDSSSETYFSSNFLPCNWDVNLDIMSPVEAIGERIIKRLSSTINSNPKKINNTKITLIRQGSQVEEVKARPEDDLIGLRDDYKLMMNKKKGYPWDQISQIEKPYLQELLISLFLIEKCDKNTLDFALFAAKKSGPTAMKILGKLLYLADIMPRLDISLDNYDSSIHWIYAEYHDRMNKIIESLSQHYINHKKTPIQSPEIALMTQMAIELSRIILTTKGAINFALIPSLIEYFVDEPIHPLNHEINVIYTFKQLQESPAIREKIAKISKPDSLFSPSNLVIRSVLDLPETVLITDFHAQQTALSGLLSHVRQGADGSCFATPLVMGLLSSHLDRCLDDFASLLSSGKLTRKVHNVSKDFPFLLRMNNKSLNSEIILKRNGEIIQPDKVQAFLWEIPGFIKAYEALGVKNCVSNLKKIVTRLFENEEKHIESKTVTVRHILQEIAKLEASQQNKIGLIFSMAYFAFEGQICNPLLGVWENSIAGMSEGEEGSIVTSMIIKTTIDVLNQKMKEIAPNEIQQRKNIKKEIIDILRERIQLHYDPIIHHATPSKDQHTTEGAFVLYDKNENPQSASWIRVDNPQEFSAFVTRIIEKARLQASGKDGKIYNNLLQYLKKEAFLQNVLSNYFNKYTKIPNSLSQHKKLKYTPWITKSGNNFSKVMQVYFEFPEEFHSTIIATKNSQDLLLKLANYARSLPVKEQEKYKKNPVRCILARIPGVHAFSLMPGHPSFSNVWSSKCNLEEWINEKLIIPGKTISNSLIQNELRDKLIEFIQNNLVEKALDYKGQLKKNMTVQEFRNFVVQKSDLSGKHLQLFDSYLYQQLPEEFQKVLSESAIHFADTNWSDGLNDLHFCFMANPGTGNLEIWAAHDDKSGMQALDQSLWLQDWELFNCSEFKK
jgi:hypothetical protein